MISITPRAGPALNLRTEYLDQLPEPQELFVENLVATGAWWSISRGAAEIGYGVTEGDRLVEFHVVPREAAHLTAAFNALVDTCAVRRVLAKSFDANLLFVAMSLPRRTETVGMLYRIIADPTFNEDPAIRVRAATNEDVANLMRIGADFFDDPGEVDDYIGAEGLMIYQTAEGVALGAGVMKRVVADRDAVDVGMVVDPEQRHRGRGTYIIAHLKSHCLVNGWRPICGCSIDNVASQRTLQRAGFASRHTLLSFHL